MNKKELTKLLIGIFVFAACFCAVAAIGWTEDDVIITYYYGFDDKYETHTVKKGYVDEPLASGRYGHVFDGWYYTDKAGNEVLFDFETEPVEANLELTAHWKPFETEILLILPSGIGECEYESIMVPYGSEFTLPDAEREGYYFAGWEDYTNTITKSGVWTLPVDIYKFSARWSKFEPGKTYFFGEYEQNVDPNGEKETIEWIPIDKKDGKYLLVSKYSLAAGCLGKADGGAGYVKWADCMLRGWLNGEFYDEAFSDAEKEMICDFYDESLGTTDKVFLLSLDEAKLLVGIDSLGGGTVYSKQEGLNYVSSWFETKVDGKIVRYPCFLTRSYRNNKNWACNGGAETSASAREIAGVRPAVWVDANLLNQK